MDKNHTDSMLKTCPNCFQQYDPDEGERMCPYCGYTETDAAPAILCPECGKKFEKIDDSPMCPFCGCDEFGVAEEQPDSLASDDGISDETSGDTYEVTPAATTIPCPECGMVFEKIDDSPMCPFCGCDEFGVAEEQPDGLASDDVFSVEESAEPEDYSEAAGEFRQEEEAAEPEDDSEAAGEIRQEEESAEPEDDSEAAGEIRQEEEAAEPEDDSETAGKFWQEEEAEAFYHDRTDDDTVDASREYAESRESGGDIFSQEDRVDSAELDLQELLKGRDEDCNLCFGCMEELKPGETICEKCGYNQLQSLHESCYLVPGTMLSDRYLVGKVLGSGGFGITYIGWDTLLPRKIAIKEYMPKEFVFRVPGKSELTVYSAGDNAEQFQKGKSKFLEEGRILAGCNNVSNVVKIYDVLSENGTSYLIMEYLEGETLRSRLLEKGHLSVQESLEIIEKILDALEAVHGYNLIHRDVAPDNIFLCKSGEVKLIDFGAARYVTSSFSRNLSVIIKPGFSPEEQYRSHGEQGSWTDVYAAGATLFKMITGVTPPESMERMSKDELIGPAGVPEWAISADRRYKHLKFRLASFFYQFIIGRKASEQETEPFSLAPKDRRSEHRERFALNTFRRLTGCTPDQSDFNEQSYAAYEIIKSIPGNVYIAMMNALNVDKDERTQSALQFKRELTGEVEPAAKKCKLNFRAFPKWMKVAGALASAVVILLVVSLSSMIVTAASNEVTTPEIINRMTDEAEKLVLDKDLEYRIVDSRVSDRVPENKVMLQEPEALTRVEKGSVVNAVISMGTEKVSVPNFIGMTKEEALQELSQLKLASQFNEDYSSVEKGKICLQDIEAGSRIAVGATVTLTVSLGLEDIHKDEVVTVPKITDLMLEEAKSRLESVNLYLDVESEKYDDKPAGTVISQSVKDGSTVKQGTAIKVVVSKGQKTVVVPYVTYKTENEAIRLLDNANLKYGIQYEFHDSVAKGNVISQSVKAEKSVAPGTTVDLVVSKGQKTVSVPNVVGSKSASAIKSIEDKGLKVTVKEETNDSVDAGKVIRQSPAAQKKVDNGSTVTIYVSKGKNSVTIPSVTGKSSADAKSVLENKGLQVKVNEQYSDTVQKGKVISQSPASNSSLAKGSTVTINVSKGVQPVTVPNVVGKSSSTASSSLSNAGLKVKTQEEYSATVAAGNVIRQSPSSNASASKGDTVTITVSKGKEPTTVPDVVGKTTSNARSAFEAAGLKVQVTEEYSETVAEGKVIRQTPTAGTSAKKGDSVTVAVSKGKQPIKVPGVVGKSSSTAKSTITSAGLKVQVTEGYSDSVASGYVIKQSPAGNASAYKNDTVTITVSKGASQWSVWMTSLPSGVSISNGYEIDSSRTEYRYRSISTSTEKNVGSWSDWSGWTTEPQSTNENKQEDRKTQYRYYRFVCPNCGDDWYGYTTCFSCGSAKYVYGSSDWGSGTVEGVHYMWYDLPKDSIVWSKATSDGSALRAKLGTGVYWYYFNNKPGDYYWSRTLYRYRSRSVTTNTVKSYGAWSAWSTTPATKSNTLDVESRKMYRYRVKPVS